MRSDEGSKTAVRARTRAAILDAAAHVWARNFAAPLGEVAERARVSRSTLRRYFADRTELVEALRSESQQMLTDAAERADTDDVTCLATLERLMRLAIDHHNRILFLFSDPNRFPDASSTEDTTLLALIARAQKGSVVDDSLEPRWIQSTFYSMVHTAAESIAEGYLAPSEAADAAVRTLLSGIGRGN